MLITKALAHIRLRAQTVSLPVSTEFIELSQDKKVWTANGPYAKFTGNGKKHSFVANPARSLLTECLRSCNNWPVL
jgi:hypothetical protein